MFFGDQLTKLQNEEKNPINRMYLTEIGIKYKSLEKAFEDAKNNETDFKGLAKSLSEFTKELNNPKYFNGKGGKGGFRSNSPLFSPSYIDDILALIIEQSGIIKQKGVRWGYQSFANSFKIDPKMAYIKKKDSIISKQRSSKYLSIVQCMDMNFRMTGTRTFQKMQIEFPILIFSTYKVFKESNLLQFESDVFDAKKTYPKAYSIVVTEYLDNNFYPKLNNSSIDSIFVLRKQFCSDKRSKAISETVLNALKQKIVDTLFEEKAAAQSFKETGLIE